MVRKNQAQQGGPDQDPGGDADEVPGAFARHAYGQSRDADQHHGGEHEPMRDLAQAIEIRNERVAVGVLEAIHEQRGVAANQGEQDQQDNGEDRPGPTPGAGRGWSATAARPPGVGTLGIRRVHGVSADRHQRTGGQGDPQGLGPGNAERHEGCLRR